MVSLTILSDIPTECRWMDLTPEKQSSSTWTFHTLLKGVAFGLPSTLNGNIVRLGNCLYILSRRGWPPRGFQASEAKEGTVKRHWASLNSHLSTSLQDRRRRASARDWNDVSASEQSIRPLVMSKSIGRQSSVTLRKNELLSSRCEYTRVANVLGKFFKIYCCSSVIRVVFGLGVRLS